MNTLSFVSNFMINKNVDIALIFAGYLVLFVLFGIKTS